MQGMRLVDVSSDDLLVDLENRKISMLLERWIQIKRLRENALNSAYHLSQLALLFT